MRQCNSLNRKRGSGRVIIRLTIDDTCLSFLYIYDKADMGNVSDAFLDDIIIEMENAQDWSISIMNAFVAARRLMLQNREHELICFLNNNAKRNSDI